MNKIISTLVWVTINKVEKDHTITKNDYFLRQGESWNSLKLGQTHFVTFSWTGTCFGSSLHSSLYSVLQTSSGTFLHLGTVFFVHCSFGTLLHFGIVTVWHFSSCIFFGTSTNSHFLWGTFSQSSSNSS